MRSPLTHEEIVKITKLQIDQLSDRFAARGLELEVGADTLEALAREGFDPVFGARPLKRLIQRKIENGVATALLKGEISEGDCVFVSGSGEVFEICTDKAAA